MVLIEHTSWANLTLKLSYMAGRSLRSTGYIASLTRPRGKPQ